MRFGGGTLLVLCVTTLGCGGRSLPRGSGAAGAGGHGPASGAAGTGTGSAGSDGAAGTGQGDVGIPPIFVCTSSTPSAIRPSNEPVPSGAVALAEAATYQAAAASASIDIADVDGDGALDLAVAARPTLGGGPGASTGQGPGILLNDGKGVFGPSALGFVPGPGAVRLADVTGDGKPDLLAFVAGEHGASLLVFENDGGGRFPGWIPFAAGDGTVWDWASLPPNPMATGDVDGDGRIDVAVLGMSSVYVVLNRGGGLFAAMPMPVPTGTSYPTAVAIVDLDGDRVGELVVTAGQQLTVFSVAFAPTVKTAVDVGPEPVSLAAGDLDRDGDIDLVVAKTTSPGVSVLLNRGAGNFDDPMGIRVENCTAATKEVAVADFNGDGILDVATLGTLDRINLLVGVGDGTFAPEQRTIDTRGVRRLAARDLNGDGRADVVVQPYYMSTSAVDPLNVFLSRSR
jgi:hypothetical protein